LKKIGYANWRRHWRINHKGYEPAFHNKISDEEALLLYPTNENKLSKKSRIQLELARIGTPKWRKK
jgi:hypothetical protein